MYTNSKLVEYTLISPNKNSPRNHIIDTITIHHMAGNLSIETCCKLFTQKKGSSNYVIGTDGRIGLSVDERDRAWTSSNATNDNRAITIEVANTKEGVNNKTWEVSDAALASTIKLVADICRRNNIQRLVWSDNKNERVSHLNGCNMTIHSDFANTLCCGPYLYSKMGYIADEVNKLLNNETPIQPQPQNDSFLVKIKIDDLNIRSGPGTNYKRIKFIDPGVYTIVEVQNGQGSRSGWGKLKSGIGWVSLDYCLRF